MLKILCRIWSLESKDFIPHITIFVGAASWVKLVLRLPQRDHYGLPQARSFNFPNRNRSVCGHSSAWHTPSAFFSPPASSPSLSQLPHSHFLLNRSWWKQGNGRGFISEQDQKEKTASLNFTPEAVASTWLWLGGRMFSSFVWFYVCSHFTVELYLCQ